MKFESFLTRERVITGISFLWLFTLMTGYYIVKPVREAFANELPTETIPYISIGVMLGMLFFNFIYDHLACLPSPRKLITIVTIFFSICLILFGFGLSASWGNISIPLQGEIPVRHIWIIAYFLFVGIYSLFTVTMFWSFINDIFYSDEARRSFGLITAGGTIGGLLGSTITSYLATKIQVENLLFLSSGLMMLTLICMNTLYPYRYNKIKTKLLSLPSDSKGESGFKLIFQSRYLQWMLVAAFLMSAGTTVLYNQMNYIVKYSIADKALRTEYWAEINLWINGIGLFFQIFLIHRSVRYLGMLPTILIAPIVDLVGSFSFICSKNISIASIYQVGHYSTEYSFNRASREMLYTPTSKDFKYQAKAIIDTFICRLGDGLTSLLLIIMTGLSWQGMASLNFIISLCRIIPAVILARYYIRIISQENK